MNPILCWTGGKSRLKKRIVARIPEHNTYVEPFVGGGSVFFAKARSQREVINDLNPDLMNIYDQVKKHPGALNCGRPKVRNIGEFKELKASQPGTKHDNACKTLTINKSSYACNMKNFNPAKANKLHIRMGNIAKRNTELHQRMRHVEIKNQDFRKVIKEADGKDTFIYLDPPYPATARPYGFGDELTAQDIFEAVKGIKGKFLLSYKDTPEIKKIFCSDFKCEVVETNYEIQKSVTGHGRKVTELLISNY